MLIYNNDGQQGNLPHKKGELQKADLMQTVVEYNNYPTMVQRKSVLQLAIQASNS